MRRGIKGLAVVFAVGLAGFAVAWIGVAMAGPVDSDGDGIPDNDDNCSQIHNPLQCDVDLDGYGQQCDADTNNNGIVDSPDLFDPTVGFVPTFGSGTGPCTAVADTNDNGVVDSPDIFDPTVGAVPNFGSAPGPSGKPCAGTIPCP